jgi:very-short-patch-repair endonuclease
MQDRCQACDHEASGKKLTNHIRREHGLKSIDYAVKYLYGGARPKCLSCGGDTRYVAFTFKKYCKDCRDVAASEAGRRGGKTPAWNRGLTKETDPRLLAQSLKVSGENNHFYGKNHTQETRDKISKTKTLSAPTYRSRVGARKGELVCLTPYDEYESRQGQYLEFKCATCGTINHKTLQAFERGSSCDVCFPNTSSKAELEIVEFVESLGVEVVRNDRKLIGPRELDILVPEARLAIEYDGIYWHSDATDHPRDLHREKSLACLREGYDLFRIYSDQWEFRQELVKSMISYRLGKVSRKVPARKCEVKQLDPVDSKGFFERSHLYGYSPAKQAWGLFHNGELVSCLTLRVPRQKKHRDRDVVEICRFASRPDAVVSGGFQRLLKRAQRWAKEKGFRVMLSYADLDTGAGGVYFRAGFEHVRDTASSYWYTDGTNRFGRFKFRARDGKPEKQVAHEAGVYRIYGAGNRVYELAL